MSSEKAPGSLSINSLAELEAASQSEVDKALEQLSGFGEQYDKFLEEQVEPDRSHGIHASEISGCFRRLVYAARGEKRLPVVDARMKRIFKVGHKLHAMLQEDFHAMAPWMSKDELTVEFEDETKIAPNIQPLAAEWGIQSSCDGIFTIRSPTFSTKMLLEIKTISPSGYEKLYKPKEEHIEQAHVYMACLDVPFVWFLYFHKGSQHYTSTTPNRFLIAYDKHIWARLERRFDRANTMAVLGELPDRQVSSECDICPFTPSCQPTQTTRRWK